MHKYLHNTDKLNLTFIDPSWNNYKNKYFFKSKEPNLSILRLINYYKSKQNYNVMFFDFKTDDINLNYVKKVISNTDVLFIEIKEFNYDLSVELINKSKGWVICFGQVPDSDPDVLLKDLNKIKERLIIVQGDIVNFYSLAFFSLKALKPGKYQLNYPKSSNLDKLPFVDLAEMYKRDYYTVYPSYKLKGEKMGFLSLTFGCPFNCIFCSQTLRISYGKQILHFSIQNSLKRIKRMLKYYSTIRFIDDELLLDKKYIAELCHEIIKQNIKFHWMAQVRAKDLDEKIIKLMKKAGCYSLNIGIESGSDRILKILKKDETVKDSIRAIQLCHKYKIKSVAYFMLGSKNETLTEIKTSIDLSIKLKPDVFQLAFFTPYKGSTIYSELNPGLAHVFHYFNYNVNFSKVSQSTLKRIYLYWYLKYYLFNPIKSLKILIRLFFFHPLRLLISIKSIIRFIID